MRPDITTPLVEVVSTFWPPRMNAVWSTARIVYFVIADPFAGGAVNDTVILPGSPETRDATTDVGSPGTPAGTISFETEEPAEVPTPFVAVTVKVYVSPFVRPSTKIGLVLPVAVWAPRVASVRSVAVTVYPVTTAPLDDPGTNETEAPALRRPATTVTGASGASTGVTGAAGAPGSPVDTAVRATTATAYESPLRRPVTVIGPSGLSAVLGVSFGRVRFVAVTLYPVIVSPPSVVGAPKSAMIDAAAGVAVTSVGALGRGAGVTASDGSDAELVPALFVAVTVNV